MKLIWLLTFPALGSAFAPARMGRYSSQPLYSLEEAEPIDAVLSVELETLKSDLVKACGGSSSQQQVKDAVRKLEEQAEQVGIGQASSSSGFLSGEWELLYAPEDITRSSPFFWAFRKAFPENSDQIFGITDAIPAPIKEVGPAFQSIEFNPESGSGKFVSRVKVATLGGAATSIMTTRASILGVDGLDGIRLKIESTKPEDSTIVKKLLGPFADTINEQSPPFPSGEALEAVKPGSSEVVLRTTFCDVGLRVSRNDDKFDEVFVWRRKELGSYAAI